MTRDSYAGALKDFALGTDPWNTNRYMFGGGNPISRVELDGHINATDSDGGGGLIVGPKLEKCPDCQLRVHGNGNGRSMAMEAATSSAPYHGATGQGLKNAAPTNGQEVLDFSMQIKSTSARRIGVDPDTGEFAIFDQTVDGVFHGHVRTWGELTGAMQSVLRKAGLVDRRGNIL